MRNGVRSVLAPVACLALALVSGCGILPTGEVPHPSRASDPSGAVKAAASPGVSTADMLVFRTPAGPTVPFRVGAAEGRSIRLGEALARRLDYPVESGSTAGADPEPVLPRRADATKLRIAAEDVAVQAVLRGAGRTDVLAALTRLSAALAGHLPAILDDADGQAALVLTAGASSLLDHPDTGLRAAACTRLSGLPSTVNQARQAVVLATVGGCRLPAWLPAVGKELSPDSLNGCLLFMPFAATIPLGADWQRACWRDAYAFTLEGRDPRALSDVLAAVLAPGPPPPAAVAVLLAGSAGRAWRFGGALTPYITLDVPARLDALWLGRRLDPAGGAETVEVQTPVDVTDADDRLAMAGAGAGPAPPAVGSTSLPGLGFQAVTARRARSCSSLGPAWRTGLDTVLTSSMARPGPVASAGPDRWVDPVLERAVTCAPQDARAAALRRDRLAGYARTLAGRVRDVKDLDRVAGAAAGTVALGGSATAPVQRLMPAVERLAGQQHLEGVGYAPSSLHSLMLLRAVAAGTPELACWWA